MAVTFYNDFKNAVAGNPTHSVVDFDGDTIKVQLHRTSAYTFAATHVDEAELPAHVSEATLGSVTVGTVGTGIVDAANTTFSAVAAGAAIDCAVVYKDTGTPGTSPLICYIDGFSVTPNGDDITANWPTGGILDFG